MTTRLELEQALCRELELWCSSQGLPYESADELRASLIVEDPELDTPSRAAQRAWLEAFITRWEASLEGPEPTARSVRRDGWIVVREERHIEPKFWICFDRADALKIAADVIAYWSEQYEQIIAEGPADTELYGDQILHFDLEDAFYVRVQPQQVRAPGDTEQ
jgi:hypothetical protein